MHCYKSYPIHVSAIPAETAQIKVGRTWGLSVDSKTSTAS
jgi:hypothetical protein